MLQRMFALVTAFALVFTPSVAFAADSEDSVSIDELSLECGEQDITFTGSATYSESTQHLVVELDGDEIFSSSDEPEDWETDAVTVEEGSHTLTATIYDKSDREDVMAEDSLDFDTSCGADGGEGSADEGDEQDCCPGPDPATDDQSAVGGGKVKGAISKKGTLSALKPLNSVFRSVYGRNPTYEEWKYWANRYLTDKHAWDAIYGAMQWHKLRGHTVGN